MFCVERVLSATRGNVDLGRDRKSDKMPYPATHWLLAFFCLLTTGRRRSLLEWN